MRNNIVYRGSEKFVYEIREIVAIAQKVQQMGVPVIWENIGDPVEKGEQVPDWIKQYVIDAVSDNQTYSYSPSKGLLKAREYIAHERNIEGGIQITPDDILFFNGLGDAISMIYRNLNSKARIIGPNPAYPTHSSSEAAHADSPYITYTLNPYNGWQPDLEEMEQKIKANLSISGILMINPDNPTGFVYEVDVMKQIVDLARKYNLFIISDEIYSNLTYGDLEYKKLAAVIEDVPGIGMRGISKEFPWPGARCGWIEFYNRDKDENFRKYTQALINSKMLEVCSTTLPQSVIPFVMSDPRYYPYVEKRCRAYKKKAEIAHHHFSKIPELAVNMPHGAFYMSIIFKEGVLTNRQALHIENDEARNFITDILAKEKFLDRRFTYNLLGSTGICVIPLTSGFNSSYHGFRLTLLEPDELKFTKIIERICQAIKAYIAS
ncbi:MAG: pyridoxal phosphate-dependent aminotransferase [Proteobacteria bacterium]|nr:pyridoxal phosphate-dependent aminotransferase [Pseudomonadota bacterium]MBU4471696.1 pyridoxal phosphate-dependent aminotransferase [Pseudomonadota bacterium]MCG2750670.1 pyridoxal phosphate-dependent aminotransferase [Desulfobacteraceae bacterium]